MDPFGLMDDPAFADLAGEVSNRLQHALDAVVEAAGDPAGTSHASPRSPCSAVSDVSRDVGGGHRASDHVTVVARESGVR